jgi:hypothetical protein
MKTSIGTAVAASAVASVTGNVGGNVTGSVGSVVGAVGSVTGAVGSVTGAVGSVTGSVGGNVTGSVGSVVGLTASNLDATVSSRLASASYTAPDNASIAAILVDTGTDIPASIADLPTNAELAVALADSDDAVLAQVALVKAKTDNLPTDPADASVITGEFAALEAHGDSTWATATGFSTFNSVTDEVTANVAKMNSATVTGNGTAGNLWRGA